MLSISYKQSMWNQTAECTAGKQLMQMKWKHFLASYKIIRWKSRKNHSSKITSPRILFWLWRLSTLSWHEIVLNYCLHFGISVTMKQQLKVTRLCKLQSISHLLLQRVQNVSTPGKELSTDESTVLWRGRFVFRQYIPGKKHQYGVKLYLLCDPSGYVWHAIVYCGRSDVTNTTKITMMYLYSASYNIG